jgi:hypothetical protein
MRERDENSNRFMREKEENSERGLLRLAVLRAATRR